MGTKRKAESCPKSARAKEKGSRVLSLQFLADHIQGMYYGWDFNTGKPRPPIHDGLMIRNLRAMDRDITELWSKLGELKVDREVLLRKVEELTAENVLMQEQIDTLGDPHRLLGRVGEEIRTARHTAEEALRRAKEARDKAHVVGSDFRLLRNEQQSSLYAPRKKGAFSRFFADLRELFT